MSDRMTAVNLPGVWGASWAEWGRAEPAYMISAIRQRAKQELEWAQKVLAAADDDFRIETYLGPHARRNLEVLQEGAARKDTPNG